MRHIAICLATLSSVVCAFAEVQVIDGKKYECRDGLCYLVEDEVEKVERVEGVEKVEWVERVAQGYMPADEFVAFLEGREVGQGRLATERGLFVLLLLVLIGGLAMNLTPCVLPMIPINLIVIGKSAKRGAAYGLGMAVAYGALGVAAAVGGLAFGDIQGSPWFNAAVAVVFVGLALALFGVWFLDFSRLRARFQISNLKSQNQGSQMQGNRGMGVRGLVFPFGMGALSAVLAGACVAPILISVLLLTADLYAKGHALALGLPFVLGLGMAFPWPFAGAGMKVLPKPGGWMKWVNRVFGIVVLGFAAWYGWLAWQGWRGAETAGTETAETRPDGAFREVSATPATLNSQLSALSSESASPILVDCWATWCKNCAAMDKVMDEEKVKKALERFTVIRMQAEDISELRKLKGFESVRGLPAFVIFE